MKRRYIVLLVFLVGSLLAGANISRGDGETPVQNLRLVGNGNGGGGSFTNLYDVKVLHGVFSPFSIAAEGWLVNYETATNLIQQAIIGAGEPLFSSWVSTNLYVKSSGVSTGLVNIGTAVDPIFCLSGSVMASLGKADTALQTETDTLETVMNRGTVTSNNYFMTKDGTNYIELGWDPALKGGILNVKRVGASGSAQLYASGTFGFYRDGNKMWDSANDGPGSFLDADTVDGVHASGFYTTGTKVLSATNADVVTGPQSNLIASAVQTEVDPRFTIWTNAIEITLGEGANAAAVPVGGIAIGYNAKGFGEGVALGYRAQGQDFGTAVGPWAEGTNWGTAVGYNAIGSGVGNIAVGQGALSTDFRSTAVGYNSRATNSYSVTIGALAEAYNQNATVVGSTAGAGFWGSAFGYQTLATGARGVAIGAQAYDGGLTDTTEIGTGTATNAGWFHYRGKAVIDPGGSCYGPTGHFSIVEMRGTNLDLLYAPIGSGGSTTNDSLTVPCQVPVVDGTATVTRAMGDTVYLILTNSPTVIKFAGDWATNTIGRVSMELMASTNSISWDVGTITNYTALTITTNTWNALFFRKGYNNAIWGVRQ